VVEMINAGLLQEAQQFFEHRNLNTLITVGYTELYEYMDGKCELDFAIELIKRDSRRYAKRQLTWFNRDKEIHWFHPDNEKQILEFVNDLPMRIQQNNSLLPHNTFGIDI
jgi:tRNA dimethylallyltransferase